MKKIFTAVAMAAIAMTGFAQDTQQYWRVEFTVPITGDKVPQGQSNNSVAATMKDNYTYCNPEHDYLDFQANGTLVARGTNGKGDNGVANPMSFRSTTTSYSETSSFYLDNGRTAQYNTSTNQAAIEKYPYMVDKIAKISAYSIPVEKVELLKKEEFSDYVYPGDGETYNGALFTFNRLPRNVAELKTLIEDENGNRVAETQDPLFVAAAFYLVTPRLLDCSQDCRDMMDYLFGTQYKALNTYGVSNKSFQNFCIGTYGGRDANGYQTHNTLFQHFAGASPANQYKPNGKGYGYDQGPYTVRVVWSPIDPTLHSSEKNCTIARVLLMANPTATSKEDVGFEDPVPHIVMLRDTNKNGWFMFSNIETYFTKGKDQRDDDF